MSVAEYYSGSDDSGFIPKVLDQVIQRMDNDLANADDIEQLRQCWDMELKTNWRSYIKGIWGLIVARSDIGPCAESLLRESATGFDILSNDFFETSNIYCQVCYEIGVILFDREEYNNAIIYFLRCLPNMYDVFDYIYIGNIFMFLDVCFNKCGNSMYSTVLAENAVIAARDYEQALEGLMITYYNEGRTHESKRVFSMIIDKYDDAECLSRTKAFAEKHLL
jgi:tetratricopeptide (TPR) repeat protein